MNESVAILIYNIHCQFQFHAIKAQIKFGIVRKRNQRLFWIAIPYKALAVYSHCEFDSGCSWFGLIVV
jgi:hypothetical protein